VEEKPSIDTAPALTNHRRLVSSAGKDCFLKLPLAALIALLALLHQDFWWWDDPTPILGFLPMGLAWHVLLSILSGVLSGAAWWLVTRWSWPEDLEESEEPRE
jgi:hypothetical protein